MPLAPQTRLLRVLEESEVAPPGTDAVTKVNMRVMCASHRNLTDMMGRGASAERQALVQVIEQNNWNMTLVAAHFKISRNMLYRKIKRHGIPIAHRSDGI
jgi:transcriptional regulator of acetoin/glycerol metabolism